MLELAIKYESEIREKYVDCIDSPEYKHYNRSGWCDLTPKIYPDNYAVIQYASAVFNGAFREVIGLLEAEITKPNNSVNITVIHFYYESKHYTSTFAKDMMSFAKYLFEYKKFNKIKIRCRESNPALEKYKKLIPKFGGKCIGISELDEMDEDGTLQNVHMFEVLRSDYLEAMNNRKEKIAATKIAKVHEDIVKPDNIPRMYLNHLGATKHDIQDQEIKKPSTGPLPLYLDPKIGREPLWLRWEYAMNLSKQIAMTNKDSINGSCYVAIFDFLNISCPYNCTINGESGYINVTSTLREE